MTPALIGRLLGLAEAQKARDLARLDALLAADRKLVAQIAEASGIHAHDMDSPEALPLARLGSRLRWADQRIDAAKRQRAALAPEIALARRAATVSLGKHHAVEHLLERAERAAAARAAARAEREAPPSPTGM